MTTKLLDTFEMVGNSYGRLENGRPAKGRPARETASQAVCLAVNPVIERLETRSMMSGNTAIQPAAGSVSAATLSAAPQVATLSASKSLIVFNSIATGHTGAAASPTESITITNTGTAVLTFGSGGGSAFSIVNDPANATQDAALFKIVNLSSLPASLQPGQSFKIQLNYTAKAVGRNAALLQILSNDSANPTTTIQVHGIGTPGLGGTNEPSLTRILRAYDIPTQVGEQESDTLYPVAPDAPTQEVPMQLLQKAGTGPVTITDLADFTDQTTPAYTFGYYNPTDPAQLNELFYITKADSQSTNPTPKGATSFDPGANPFGLYFQSPLKDNGQPRIGYSQSEYNTWDSTQQQKFRFFPMENPDGSIVPNTFIVTTTEWNAPNGYDFHNIVAIISNVKAAPNAAGAAVLSLQSSDFAPDTTNLLFSKVQVEPSPPLPEVTGPDHYPVTNVVHDTDTLNINNTGDTPLVINSITLSNKAWALVNPPAAGTTIAPGGSLAVTVDFVAATEPAHSYNETNSTWNPNYGGIYSGTLTINSSDPVHPKQSVNLEGWWQYEDERDMEPSLQSLVNTIAGYGTDIAPTTMTTLPQPTSSPLYYGDEVNSPYWTMADPNVPVNVLALAAWHTESYATTSGGAVTSTNQAFGEYPAYTRSITSLLTTSGADAQTILPHPIINGVEVDENATATFTASGNFGFVVDGYEFSDDSTTPQTAPNPTTGIGFGTGGGHVLRFYPLRLANGSLVPNTYIVGLDYNAVPGQNFDFQDGVWIVSGIRPAGIRENNPPAGVAQFATAPAPINLQATSASGGGVTLQWALDSSYTGAVTYNVYSSTSLNGTYSLLTSTPISATAYTDLAAAPGKLNYYKVTSVDPATGYESDGNEASALAAPAAPSGLAAVSTATGVGLTWTKNTEADLAGYNVYRSLLPTEGFTLLNTNGLLTSSNFTDTTAPGGVTSYYLVTAVDTSGNEGASAATSAVSGSGPYTGAPAAVSGLAATANDAAVTLSWQPDSGAYLAGYNVYSGTSANGPFTLLNTAGLLSTGTTTYSDTTAEPGVTTYYQVVAVDAFGNDSPPVTTSGVLLVPPAPPTGLGATASAAGISLSWNAVPGAAGYNVYRSTSANGTFVLLNTRGRLTAAGYLDAAAPLGATSYYQVVSVDSAGDLSSAALANAFIAKSPAAPAGLTPVAPVTGGVTLSWNANTESDLAGYNVYRSGSANGTFTLLNTGGLLTSPAYTDASTSPGATYYYRVVAVDTLARVSPAAATNVTTPLPPAPAAPAGLQAVPAPYSVILSWNANTELDLAGYDIYRSGSANGTFTLLNTGGLLTSPSYTDASTSPGATYYYQVVAVDTLARVSPVAATNVTTPLPAAPAEPAGLQSAAAPNSVTLSWTANTELDLAGYNVYRSNSANGTFTLLNTGGLLSSPSYTDASTSPGVTYYYQVVAVDTLTQVSPAAATHVTTTLPTAPAAPAGLQAAVYPTAITLSWNANSESDVAGYLVFRGASANGPFQQINPGGVVETATSLVDTNAPIGTPSYYKVVAVDVYGQDSLAASISATRPATAPAAPAGLSAVDSVKSVTLSWNANTETDQAGYRVFRATSANGVYQQLNAGVQTSTTFVDKTAPAKVASYYRVFAVNVFGMVSAPATFTATRLAANTPPAIPVGFAATASTTGVSLTWDVATGAAADDVAGYYVYRCYSAHGHYNRLDSKPLSAATLAYVDKTAAAKVKVYYEVRAISPTGVLSAPAWVSTVRPASPKVAKPQKR